MCIRQQDQNLRWAALPTLCPFAQLAPPSGFTATDILQEEGVQMHTEASLLPSAH